MNISLRFSNAEHMKHVVARAILCSVLLVLPSCHIPAFKQAEPGPGLPGGFKGATNSENASPKGATSPENSAQLGIEEFYNDPMLTGLIHQALVGNRELKMLEQEVQIADNEVLARSGAYLPFVTVGAGASAERPSRYTRDGAVESELAYPIRSQILPGKLFPDPLPDYKFGLNFLWTPDIFRALRNAKDAAAQRYIAAIERRNYFVTRLVAEIAENYYSLIALDKRLETLDQTIELQEQSRKISQARVEAGRGNALPVQRFQADVRKNQSEKLLIQQEIVEAENRINFRVNRLPEPVARMATAGFFDLNIHALSVGVPAQLLLNRPDIRQAERELTAAGLEVKAARAQFFPSGAITASVGYEAFNPKYLFNPEAIFANAAGELMAPLINKRAIKANYLTANARQLESVYNYQRIILDAFTEVVNRVSKVEKYRQSLEIKKQQLASLEAAVEIATKLFQNARAEYGDVLFSLRDLLEARTVLIQTKSQQLSAIVNAYQALGGGDLSSISNRALMQCLTLSPNPRDLPAMLPAPAVAPASSKPGPASDKDKTLPVPREVPAAPEKAKERKDSTTGLRPMESPAAANSQPLLQTLPLIQPRGSVGAGIAQSIGN